MVLSFDLRRAKMGLLFTEMRKIAKNITWKFYVRTLILETLVWQYLLDIQMVRLDIGYVYLEFQDEVQGRAINLGVGSLYNAMTMDKIT